MIGWRDEIWKDERMKGWKDERMKGWKYEWMNEWMNEWINEWMNGLPSNQGATHSSTSADLRIVSGRGRECRTIAP